MERINESLGRCAGVEGSALVVPVFTNLPLRQHRTHPPANVRPCTVLEFRCTAKGVKTVAEPTERLIVLHRSRDIQQGAQGSAQRLRVTKPSMKALTGIECPFPIILRWG